MSPILRVLLLLALLSAVLSAQDRASAPASGGTTVPFAFNASPSNIRESRATPADVKASEASARKLADLIAEVPALNPPVGFLPVMVGVLMTRDATQARIRPVAPFDIWLRFGAPEQPRNEINFLHFFINDLRPVILDHLGVRKWEDERGDFYLEPPRTGDVGGFPMYNDLLVVARPGDSIWAPVPVERVAKALAAQLKGDAADAENVRNRAKADLDVFLSQPEVQKRRAEIDAARQRADAASEIHRLEAFFAEDETAIRRKVNPDPSQPRDAQWYFGPVNAYRDVLSLIAGLDPAGRGAPGCVSVGDTPERWRLRIVPVGTLGCHRVVEANLGLFKPELPRSAIQLITVEDIARCRNELASPTWKTVGDCAANLEVVRQLDWSRVAGLLEK